jgi:hypothetical protein
VLGACARPFLGGCAMAAVCLAVLQLGLGETTGMFVAAGLATAVYVPFVWPLIRLARGRGGEPEPPDGPSNPQAPGEHAEAQAETPFEEDTAEIAVPELRRHW